jgi:hypothetical protein
MIDRPPAGLVVLVTTLYSSVFAFLWWRAGIDFALTVLGIVGLVAFFAAACLWYDLRHQ